MNRPLFPLLFFIAVAALSSGGETAVAEESSKPNILFIFADDLAYDCIASYGNDQVKTPNLDRLAKRSTTFTHCYNMGGWNGAICAASRAMLNTGQFIWRANDVSPTLSKEYVPKKMMWSQMLGEAGYDTYFTGKWHVTAKPDTIFKTAKNVRGGMPNQTKAGYNRPLSRDDTTWQPWDEKFGGFWEGGKHWSEVVADDAEEFLATATKSENPFFMYIAFNAAHDPRQAPKEFVDMYPVDNIKIPEPFYEEYPYNIGCNRIRDEVLAPFPRTEYAVKKNRQEYYAIITHMDREIGRILAALEKTGKADNTYIVFTADHGLAVGHHGFMGKQNMYDHSVRVPFMIAGPNVPADKRHDAKIYLQDIMPTTLELAEIDKPERVEFKSVLPLVHGEKKESYDVIYGAYIDVQRMIIDGDYKLIVYPKIGKMRLFNLKNDPLELKDLIDDPAQSQRIAQLAKNLQALQHSMGDKLTLDDAGTAKKNDQKSAATR